MVLEDFQTSPPRVSQCWLLLAVSALGLAAVAAVFLVLARTPILSAFVESGAFPRALVVHVNLATTIWYFAMANALWTETLPKPRHVLGATLAAVSAAGAAGVVWLGFATHGNPVLANYVPYVDAGGFLACLTIFAVGAIGSAVFTLRRPRDAAEWGFAIARWPFLMAPLYIATAMQRGTPLPDALWGAGHILQFGYVTLLMAIWLRLAERAGMRPFPQGFPILLFCAAALPATAGPAVLLFGQLEPETLHIFHTRLMQWANWPAPLLLALALATRAATAPTFAESLLASIGLFVAGIVAGALITDQTTMIPAHYHGTIGAFTLAQMGAVLARVSTGDRAGRLPGKAWHCIRVYAVGTAVLIAGLAWSGLLGAPRKTGFIAQGADLSAILAATTVGAGGAVAILGISLFVIFSLPRTAKLCLQPPRQEPPPRPAPTFAAAH